MLPDVDQLGTVVVCEDDEPTLALLCEHLTADRYRALPAPSASDALRLCHFKQSEPYLIKRLRIELSAEPQSSSSWFTMSTS
jgi:DNA-binding response OmpR family regulator